jgi:hypothetical protein
MRARVTFSAAAHTKVRLTEVARRVLADQDYWRMRGVRIAQIMIPSDGSTVQCVSPQPAARELIPGHYGGDIVSVIIDDVVPL